MVSVGFFLSWNYHSTHFGRRNSKCFGSQPLNSKWIITIIISTVSFPDIYYFWWISFYSKNSVSSLPWLSIFSYLISKTNSAFKQEQDINLIHSLTFRFPLAIQDLLYLSNHICSSSSLTETALEYWVKIRPQEDVPQKRKESLRDCEFSNLPIILYMWNIWDCFHL